MNTTRMDADTLFDTTSGRVHNILYKNASQEIIRTIAGQQLYEPIDVVNVWGFVYDQTLETGRNE